MSHPDPMLDSRKYRARAETPRPPVIERDAQRIETCMTAAGISGWPIALTPEEVDEQIRQFFASDQL